MAYEARKSRIVAGDDDVEDDIHENEALLQHRFSEDGSIEIQVHWVH